ncbi:MAG: penicillin acylase family protein [Proteobacteria bacterium]|nr:penicillin acylase family protein [Pseudomonadota bacterium]
MSAVRARRVWGMVAAVIALLLVAVLLAGYLTLRASLPRLSGTLRQAGLVAPVRIERDWRGVPTIEAANREDLAFATGFVHAQDRFFQMDLSRRAAAGELSALVGRAALEHDRIARLFRFRAVARAVMAAATPRQQAIAAAYARGVNAGLADLGARPWEYWVLRARVEPWKPEDTILVIHAMWWDLQVNSLKRAMVRLDLNSALGGPLCAGGWKCALQFFYPQGTSWDAPNAPGDAPPPLPEPAIPGPEALNVRAAPPAPSPAGGAGTEPVSGSNNWAVAGRLTASGAALVASDMHLNQRVPAVWYHARLRLRASATAPALDLNGVTLPGTPLLVAGSNGHVAWAFTNSYGDWADVQRIACGEVSDDHFVSGTTRVALTTVHERIAVRGAAPDDLAVRSGEAGVLLERDSARGICWFGRWLAQLPAATNMNALALEQVDSAAAALDLAPQIGIPHQNAVLGDAAGHIGWTIFGRIPLQTGARRAAGESPWTDATTHPRLLDPRAGRIWTANARPTADPRQLQLLGGPIADLGADYDLGARASQIRDDLAGLRGPATPADMLRIQLDDRAVFLARWQALLLGLLDRAALAGHPQRGAFRDLVAHWNGRASVDSVGYRLVRAFHEHSAQAAWEMLLAGAGLDPQGRLRPAQFEGPLWRLVISQPQHLLVARYGSWREFLLAQVDAAAAQLAHECADLPTCTWGRYNTVRIAHPLAQALPGGLGAPLNMPVVQLPGDQDMPRVQRQEFGASERFAVAPGHESEGYLHIPGGQSGHPLSPYYRAGFMAWARGQPLPLLPGPAQHILTLTP